MLSIMKAIYIKYKIQQLMLKNFIAFVKLKLNGEVLMKIKVLEYIIVFIIIITSALFINLLRYTDILILKAMIYGMVVVSINMILKIVFKNSQNKIIKFIKKVFDKIAGVFLLIIMYIQTYIMGIVMMAFIFITLIGITYISSKYILGGIISYKGSIYLSAVVTLVISSYKGSKLLDLFIRVTGNTKGVLSGYCNYKGIEYFAKLNIRKLCYEISIALYILTKTINLGEISVLSNENVQLISSLVAEVFLTFVAIDCYICTFKNGIINNNMSAYEEIKRSYLEKYNKEYKKYKESTLNE